MDNFEELERQANLLKLKQLFIDLLMNIKREGMTDLVGYIESTDFFEAPASSHHHLAHVGGLLEHSINVYNRFFNILTKDELYKDLNVSKDTIIICALLHDLCKANFYTIAYRKTKVNDVWIDAPYYAIDDKFPAGHGEKSVFLISRFIKLTDDEILAIRYHMGAYLPDDVKVLNNVYNRCPMALALHIADSEATSIIEKNK